MLRKARVFTVRLVSLALVATGFIPFAHADVIDTGYMVDSESREASLAHIQVMLASDAVANQLDALGVDQSIIAARLQGLSDAELIQLEGKMEDQLVAGADVIAVVGIVFVVLMILELVGVTDIFKSF